MQIMMMLIIIIIGNAVCRIWHKGEPNLLLVNQANGYWLTQQS